MEFNRYLCLLLILPSINFLTYGMEQDIKKDSSFIAKFGKSSLKDLTCAYILQSKSEKVNLAKALALIPDLQENFDLIAAIIENNYNEQEIDIIIECMAGNFKAFDKNNKKLINHVYFQAIAQGHVPIVKYLNNFIDQEIYTSDLDIDLVINSYKFCPALNHTMDTYLHNIRLFYSPEEGRKRLKKTLKLLPLMIAVLNQQSEMVKILVEQNPFQINKPACVMHGSTPLHVAVENGDSKTINILISYGADVNSKTLGVYNVPVLNYAIGYAHYSSCYEILELLLNNNAEVNIQHNRSTPLMLAASIGCIGAVQLLLKYKADPSISANGETALSLAQLKGHTDIVDILKSHMS